MSEKEYHPCSKEKGFCISLESVTQPDGHHKGLSFLYVCNHKIETIEFPTIGVVCRKNRLG